MDFEELMAKLGESEEFGTEAQDAIKARLNKANSEAKNQRKRRKEAEAKLSKNPVLDILKEHGLEIDEDADISEATKEFIASMKTTDKNDKPVDYTKSPDFIKMQKKLDKIMKENEETKAKAQQLAEKNNKAKIENALQSNFSSDIANGKTVLNLLLESKRNPFIIDENGDIGFKLPDGDVITGTQEIISEYKKMHPDQVKNKSKSGVDSKSTMDNFQVPKKFTSLEQVKSMTPEQINKLTPEQHSQMMQVVAENSK